MPDAVRFTHAELDITDEAAVRSAMAEARPQIVMNAGAYTHVDHAEVELELAREINVVGARIVASAATDVGAAAIYPSTNFVFAGDRGVYREDHPTDPISAYGRTKADGEKEVLAFPSALVIRTSAVFGEGTNFISQILTVARDNAEVRVVDDQFCQPTHATDLAAASLELARAGAIGTFHVAGNGEPGSWADVAEHALKVAGLGTTIVRVSTAEYYEGRTGPIAPRPPRAILDLAKAGTAGLRLRPWRDAVTEYVEAR